MQLVKRVSLAVMRLPFLFNTTMPSKSAARNTETFRALAALALGLLLGAWLSPGMAAQSSAPFIVSVNLNRPAISSVTGLCSSNTGVGAFGATVTVVCGTGIVTSLEAVATGIPRQPTHGGAYRFLTRVSSDNMSGTVDSYTGAGTSTAYRLVSLAGRDYIEMTVGW